MTDPPTCCSGVAGWLSPELFKALSDPNRVSLLARLAESCRDQTVSELARCCPVNLSVVSRHLRHLRDAGVVESHKRGKEVYYRVRVQALVGALRGLADALEACCPTDPDREIP